MADDIDDLLREVEEKFLPGKSTATVHNSADGAAAAPNGLDRKENKTTQRAHSSDLATRELEDDLSDLLEDGCRVADPAAFAVGLRLKRSPRRSTSARELLNDSTTKVSQQSLPSSSKRSVGTGNGIMDEISSPTVERQKCYPIYLSGVIDSVDTAHTVRVCTQLRCTGCDFRVSQFAHYRWRPGVDYLFLRNHMPEFDRVRIKLKTEKFCRAYACQCLFVTIKDLIDLNKLGHTFASKWVCTGH